MKKIILIIFFNFVLTGCYSQLVVKEVEPVRTTSVVRATTPTGSVIDINTENFLVLYNRNPSFYSEWRFFWRDTWIPPYHYYRYYYRPYQPIWIYYPYPQQTVISLPPTKQVVTPSKPRSSGVSKNIPSNTRKNTNRPSTTRSQRQRSN